MYNLLLTPFIKILEIFIHSPNIILSFIHFASNESIAIHFVFSKAGFKDTIIPFVFDFNFCVIVESIVTVNGQCKRIQIESKNKYELIPIYTAFFCFIWTIAHSLKYPRTKMCNFTVSAHQILQCFLTIITLTLQCLHFITFYIAFFTHMHFIRT